jgi:hypothetical protein
VVTKRGAIEEVIGEGDDGAGGIGFEGLGESATEGVEVGGAGVREGGEGEVDVFQYLIRR